jgi:histidinol-phosphate/aromatic aminotransferase/cobyric acid decarboxylase-like protein
MQQLAAALREVGSQYHQQGGAAAAAAAAASADAEVEAQVGKMRDMLRAALMELSAFRSRAQAAGGAFKHRCCVLTPLANVLCLYT